MALRPYPPPQNRRLDPELYAIAGHPCFFTVRASRGLALFASSTMAGIVVETLLAQREKSGCDVAVYCVMPDHVHVIVTPIQDGASSLTFVDRFKGWCGRAMRLAGWTGPIWQPRSYDHLLTREERVQAIATYILHNPVRRGLSSSPEEYPWCGIPARLADAER